MITGPPASAPNWLRFNGSIPVAKKLRASMASLRRNSHAAPWSLLVPGWLVTSMAVLVASVRAVHKKEYLARTAAVRNVHGRVRRQRTRAAPETLTGLEVCSGNRSWREQLKLLEVAAVQR